MTAPVNTQQAHEAILRLAAEHQDWGYKKLGAAVGRSASTAEAVIHAYHVCQGLTGAGLIDRPMVRIGPGEYSYLPVTLRRRHHA